MMKRVLSLALFTVCATSLLGHAGVLPELPTKLFAMAKEPLSLRGPGGAVEQFRFTYVSTFSVPLIVRVTKSGPHITLRALRFTGAESGRVVEVRTRRLTVKEWQTLKTLANATQFWAMEPDEDVVGLDGNTWILEGVSGHAYQIVSRWSPTFESDRRQLGRFVVLGRYLAKLSPLPLQVQ